MRLRSLPALLALLLACHGAAFARDDQCGEYTSVDTGESTTELGNKTMYMQFRSSTQMNAAQGSKFNNLSGQCTGGAVLYPDKTIEAEGLCAVADVDGDVLTYGFIQARGKMEGEYTRKGGTGKFANSNETGWFRPIKLDGEITRGNWGGPNACK